MPYFRSCFAALALLLCGAVAQAKPLTLDAEYAVFGGNPVKLKQVIGQRPVYLKFWATWCLDCRRELPSLQRTYEQYRHQLAIYAVNLNINETDEYIRALQQKHQLTVPIVMDNNGSIAGNFEFPGTPFHVLLNAQGDVVYTTHHDDEALAQQLALLAQGPAVLSKAVSSKGQAVPLEGVPLEDVPLEEKPRAASPSQPPQVPGVIPPLGKQVTLVYFSATWCDWYMKEIHPEMSANCARATELMNRLYQQKQPGQMIQAYVTHLWTEAKDLAEYQQKFAIGYPVAIDQDNRIARHYQVTEYPTLIIFNNQQEVKRYTQFNDVDALLTDLAAISKASSVKGAGEE